MGNFDNYYIDGNGNAHRDIPLGTSPADAYVRTNMKLKKEVQRIDGAMQEVSKHIDVEISRLDEEIANTADGASRQIESALSSIDSGLVEAAQSMGSSPLGIIFRVYLKESIPHIVRVTQITAISLIGLMGYAICFLPTEAQGQSEVTRRVSAAEMGYRGG